MANWSIETPAESQVIEALYGGTESDRGAAILAATFLENRLERRIKMTLRHDSMAQQIAGEMFRATGALGAFESKIRIGFLLRIYGSVVYREMQFIKKIRNQFAHIIGEHAVLAFSEQPIRDWCGELKIVENYHRSMSEVFSMADFLARTEKEQRRRSGQSFSDNPSPDVVLKNPRKRYLETCGLFAERLEGTAPFLILGEEPEPWP